VTGTRLKLPEGIWVSARVAKAINAQAVSRQKAFTAIDRAEKGRKALRILNGSSPEGDRLLEDSKVLVAKEPSYFSISERRFGQSDGKKGHV
jgi:hypothetical protein